MFSEVVRETLRGKTLGRILTNRSLRGTAVSGRVLEVGKGHGKSRASHWRYLDDADMVSCVTVDIQAELKPDIVADICAGLPCKDGEFDTILAFNLLEHLAEPEKALVEMRRVLKDGGSLIGSVPFMVGVHGDPYDYRRFTGYALEGMFKGAGFSHVSVKPIGGPFAAAYAQVENIYPRWLRLFKAPWVVMLDRTLARFFQSRTQRTPTDYVFNVK